MPPEKIIRMASYYTYWGKAQPSEAEGARYHLLPYHGWDVAAVAATWWDQDRALQRLFTRAASENPQRLRAWLLFFTALHDLGKFDARFQWKAPEAARCLTPAFEKFIRADRDFSHGAAGYTWFCREAEAYGFDADADDAKDWMQAVAGHHGASPGKGVKPSGFAAPEVIAHDRHARIEWVATVRARFLTPAGIKIGEEPPPLANALLAGFVSVVDWIGSNTGEHGEYFRYEDQPEQPDYFEDRQPIALRSLHEFGVYRSALIQGGMGIFPSKTPRGVQTLVDTLPVEPGLTLIEAPTGAGKTEAALAYASRLLAAGLADSVIFALPTQATSNAMLTRFIEDHIGGALFPGETQEIILAHGKARFNPNFHALQAAARHPNRQGTEEALNQCCQWLATSRKRVFLGQIGICTIDQVLLSVLPIRHHFVRALGIHKSVLIIDEIHAYDWYMYGLLSKLLENQAQVGGSLILLSATLPEITKTTLLNAWKTGNQPATTSQAYPLITHVGATPNHYALPPVPDGEEKPERSVRFSLHAPLLPDEILLENIVQAARQGAKVALVCNLVHDAQTLWAALQPRVGEIPLDLFHARFRFYDRDGIERAVLANYGKHAAPGGRILVATQVVEQSLDLDFDWLITQICPVDLLFQRLGRLHRHSRPRPPGYEPPQCTVLVPEDEDYGVHALLYGAREDRKTLPNRRILWRTRRMVEATPRAAFPQVYRAWIERVYQEEAWSEEPADIQAEYELFRQAQDGKYYTAKFFANQAQSFPDDDEPVAAMTRDGEMNLVVFPCTQRDGKRYFLGGDKAFKEWEKWAWQEAIHLNGVSVPASWQKYLPALSADPHNDKIQRLFLPMRPVTDEKWRADTEKCRFEYDQRGGLQRLLDE